MAFDIHGMKPAREVLLRDPSVRHFFVETIFKPVCFTAGVRPFVLTELPLGWPPKLRWSALHQGLGVILMDVRDDCVHAADRHPVLGSRVDGQMGIVPAPSSSLWSCTTPPRIALA